MIQNSNFSSLFRNCPSMPTRGPWWGRFNKKREYYSRDTVPFMTNLWSKILYAGENKAVPDNIVLHRAWGTATTIHDQFDSVLLKGIGIATIGLVDTGLMGGGRAPSSLLLLYGHLNMSNWGYYRARIWEDHIFKSTPKRGHSFRSAKGWGWHLSRLP